MRHVGHSVRCITIESLKFVLIGTDNHQVWANVELMAGRTIFRRFPGAEIHVRDADAINVRRAARKAILHPLQGETSLRCGLGAYSICSSPPSSLFVTFSTVTHRTKVRRNS